MKGQKIMANGSSGRPGSLTTLGKMILALAVAGVLVAGVFIVAHFRGKPRDVEPQSPAGATWSQKEASSQPVTQESSRGSSSEIPSAPVVDRSLPPQQAVKGGQNDDPWANLSTKK